MKDFHCAYDCCTKEEIYAQEIKEAKEVQTVESLDKKEHEDETLRCRICFEEHNSEADPLMLACQCKGATGLVHFKCLERWVHS